MSGQCPLPNLSIWFGGVVRVFCLVVHDQLVVHKVEAITAGLEGVLNDGSLPLWAKQWHVVNRLPAVRGVRDAKSEGEVERLHQHVAEVVALDHAEVGNWLRADTEDQFRPDRTIPKKGRREVIANGSASNLHFGRKASGSRQLVSLALNVEQRSIGLHITNGELEEFNAIRICG